MPEDLTPLEGWRCPSRSRTCRTHNFVLTTNAVVWMPKKAVMWGCSPTYGVHQNHLPEPSTEHRARRIHLLRFSQSLLKSTERWGE